MKNHLVALLAGLSIACFTLVAHAAAQEHDECVARVTATQGDPCNRIIITQFPAEIVKTVEDNYLRGRIEGFTPALSLYIGRFPMKVDASGAFEGTPPLSVGPNIRVLKLRRRAAKQ